MSNQTIPGKAVSIATPDRETVAGKPRLGNAQRRLLK